MMQLYLLQQFPKDYFWREVICSKCAKPVSYTIKQKQQRSSSQTGC